MVGRKALVLSGKDINLLIKHVQDLPFKRKIHERFLAMVQGKRTMSDFSLEDLELVKKCRYEMNAHQKQMRVLQRIKDQSSHSAFERDILDLSERKDIDSYFLMLDALKTCVRKVDQRQAEAKLRNDKKRMERKQDDAKAIARKQRDRENYFLGAAFRKLLEATEVFPKKRNDVARLCTVVNCARLVELLAQHQVADLKKYNELLNSNEKAQVFDRIITEIMEDPRNPFN